MNLRILPAIMAVISLVPCLAAGGMFKNLDESGHPWHFDGREFVPGPAEKGIVILVRDGYVPVPRSHPGSTPKVALPDDLGALAGFCYVQMAGGKLAGHTDALPVGECALEITGPAGVVWRVTADDRGFFSLPLPAGLYEVRGTGASVRVTVTAGRSALVAVRTGKRMVD